jgi:hypothetical protein
LRASEGGTGRLEKCRAARGCAVKQIMLVSTIVWFAAAPFWMKVE